MASGEAAPSVDFVITGAGGVGAVVNGSYRQAGEHEGRPMYRQVGGESVLFFRGFWKLNDTTRTCVWRYSVPDATGEKPPTGPWTTYGYSLADAQPPPTVAEPSGGGGGVDRGDALEGSDQVAVAKAEGGADGGLKISASLRAEILEAFASLDEKSDGTVAQEDLKSLFVRLDAAAFTEEGLEGVFAAVGVSDDGRLKYADFIEFVFGSQDA